MKRGLLRVTFLFLPCRTALLGDHTICHPNWDAVESQGGAETTGINQTLGQQV